MALSQPLNLPLRLTSKEAKDLGLKKYRSYILDTDYTYHWKIGGKHFRITIPAGFKYDGASVPRVFWSVTGFLPDGLGRAAALVHDFIYVHKGKMPTGCYQVYKVTPPIGSRQVGLVSAMVNPGAVNQVDYMMSKLANPPLRSPEWVDAQKEWTRPSADRMFARLLREGGVPKIRRRLAFRAVQAVGWYWWNKDNVTKLN